MGVAVTISPRGYDAVLFDLDGVLTRTASLHAAVWKNAADIGTHRDATGDSP
jgi:beta-phosphoglucomutase-like phosphatase (HAD superfamily)